ncbi:MAG: response regulator transcription factor [Actinomycetota bacterium]
MGKQTVLIADDDPVIVGLLVDVLEMDGYRAVGVEDGMRALEALDMQTPDLVILDIMMPGCSGIEVLRRLRARHETKYTPVVIVSAKRDEMSVWEGLSNGCDHYITKPFDPSELSSLVRRMLAA